MDRPRSDTAACSGLLTLDDLALDLLRERQRRAHLEFHLQRSFHDLANHLHAIELRVSFLELQNGHDPVVEELTQSCAGARRRIQHLTEDAGLRPRAGEAGDPLHAVSFAAALARRDGATVLVGAQPADGSTVPGNAGELAILFINLFDNAREAGGRIQVDARDEDSRMLIRVADDGPGLAAGPNIWKPFFTTKGATHRGHGLPVAAQIARRYGGSIEAVDSSRGACFQVTLPQSPQIS